MEGLGSLHHPVTTTNAEAQKFFDQGLTLLYAFNHEEARRSFEQAARLDPKLAMAYWGIALAVGPNYNEPEIDPSRLLAADRALEKAAELGAGATDAEREYIAALAKRFGGNYALAVQKRIGVQTDLKGPQLTFHAFVEQLTNRVSYMPDANLDSLAQDQDLRDADHDRNTQELESGVQPQKLLAFFGYHAGTPVSGLWGFQMRLFTPIPLAQIKDPAVRASCIEFVLAGLYATERISRIQAHGRTVYDTGGFP